jgi:uncharacterized protein YprB with RNaseH-like and TPR domain
MSSLSDRLKSLGVKVGTRGLNQEYPRKINSIDELLGGEYITTQSGETYLVEKTYPASKLPGSTKLDLPLNTIASWAGDERIADLSLSSFAFLDTETTGLSGGTGTYAFLIGVGRYIGDDFSVAQFFMQDPSEESAQLLALENFLAPCNAMVTYNGKSFDIPLLLTRYRAHDWKPLLKNLYHIDLLHLSRRLWRDRLANRSLNSLEVHILGTQRTEEDVPGWMIPQLYFNYLRDGDAQPLKSVFYHNAMDILSLASLFNHTASLLSNPTGSLVSHGVDLLSLGRLFEDLGQTSKAIELYNFGLEHDDAHRERIPRDIFLRALFRMSMIHKRAGNMDKAVQLWEHATRYQFIPAHIELAKYYEHKIHDIEQAILYTQEAKSIITDQDKDKLLRLQWEDELDHRMERLARKRDNLK